MRLPSSPSYAFFRNSLPRNDLRPEVLWLHPSHSWSSLTFPCATAALVAILTRSGKRSWRSVDTAITGFFSPYAPLLGDRRLLLASVSRHRSRQRDRRHSRGRPGRFLAFGIGAPNWRRRAAAGATALGGSGRHRVGLGRGGGDLQIALPGSSRQVSRGRPCRSRWASFGNGKTSLGQGTNRSVPDR
jgi:hypothetical protein